MSLKCQNSHFINFDLWKNLEILVDLTHFKSTKNPTIEVSEYKMMSTQAQKINVL